MMCASLVAVVSCGTLPKALSNKEPEVEIVTKKEFIRGETVVAPIPDPPADLVADPKPLSTEFVMEDDIGPDDAMATALSWAGSYHSVVSNYMGLRGWILGLKAGQQMLTTNDQDQEDSDQVDQERVPE